MAFSNIVSRFLVQNNGVNSVNQFESENIQKNVFGL